jgi:hypothetical protein
MTHTYFAQYKNKWLALENTIEQLPGLQNAENLLTITGNFQILTKKVYHGVVLHYKGFITTIRTHIK